MIEKIYDVFRSPSFTRTAYVNKNTFCVFFISAKDHRECFETKEGKIKTLEDAQVYANAWILGMDMACNTFPSVSVAQTYITNKNEEQSNVKPLKQPKTQVIKPEVKPEPKIKVKKEVPVQDNALDELF